jgi:hypothetical protein
MQKKIYIAQETSINVYIHLSDYWSGRKLKKIELSHTIKFSVFQTVFMWEFYMHTNCLRVMVRKADMLVLGKGTCDDILMTYRCNALRA